MTAFDYLKRTPSILGQGLINHPSKLMGTILHVENDVKWLKLHFEVFHCETLSR